MKRGKLSLSTLEEENKIMEIIGKLSMEGKEIPKILWVKLDAIKKARKKGSSAPGPGSYSIPSGFGRQPQSTYKNAGGPKFGPSKRQGEVLMLPSVRKDTSRVKLHPRFYEDDSTPFVFTPIDKDVGNVLSTYKRTPAVTLKGRPRDVKPDVYTSDPVIFSGFGDQSVAAFPSAGRPPFSVAKRFKEDHNAAAMPSVHSYNPKFNSLSTIKTGPAARVLGPSAPEYNPFLDSRAAPGSYEIPSGFGSQTLSSNPSIPGFTFGPTGSRKSYSQTRFMEAQQRAQPMELRATERAAKARVPPYIRKQQEELLMGKRKPKR